MKVNRMGIAAILPRGETFRNFVYSGALDFIKSSGVGVTVLAVHPNDDIWASLQRSYSAANVHELQTIPARYAVRVLREVLDVCHGRWLWSEAAQARWRLRNIEASDPWSKVRRTGKKLLTIPLANRPALRVLERVERSASWWLRNTDHYLNLYRKIKPTLVFNASHVHSQNAIPAVEAAQWLGIPTATFIFSWDNLTSQGRVMPPYDYYLVWNEALRDQLLQIYRNVPRDRVFVTGTPQFDCHFRREFHWTREDFFQRMGADPTRPLVFYSTGMSNHMPGEEVLVEQIADRLKQMGDLGRPQLLVRVYAKDRTGRFEPLRTRRPDILFPEVLWEPNCQTPKLEDAYVLANTLRYCSLGINVASTVSLELCMFDKPVINVGYNPPSVPTQQINYARYYRFDHYRPVVESGAVKVARSLEEMDRMIRDALAHPEAGRTERGALVRAFFADSLDGRSGERAAKVLIDLARQPAAAQK